MVVTIDGPGGVGKSSVSRAVAALKGMKHLDTGAYYRAATFVTLRSGASVTEPESVVAAIDEVSFDLESGRMWLDGEDVSEAIRGDGVTAAVSTVAAMPAVRSRMVDYQRAWAARHDDHVVVEGRDIGTVVFPDAAVKVFLIADAEVRAARRAGDAEAGGRSIAAIGEDLRKRDAHDSSRETSPLVAADDATVIDTTNLSLDEVVAVVMGLVDERTGHTMPQGVVPYLLYEDVAAAITWLGATFGFRERLTYTSEAGELTHAEMETGSGLVMLGYPGSEYPGPSLDGHHTTHMVVVMVDDVDGHHAIAAAAGAEILDVPQNQPYGHRSYRAADLEGHAWNFAQVIAVVAPDDWGAVMAEQR